jgi:SAM-dependent methyltransferase
MPTAREVCGWDVVNWSAALRIWGPHAASGSLDCLEVGSGPGGCSLWLACQGHRVVCSDFYDGPNLAAVELHNAHGVSDRIKYEVIDATAIPYTEQFDIVLLKSVLGGIWASRGTEGLYRTVREIHKALRPGGKFLFAENLRASRFHAYCRRRFVRDDSSWLYPTIERMKDLLSPFARVEYKTFGFLGTFGRNEAQRKMLGYLDKVLVPLLPPDYRYIMAGVAFK